MTPIKIIQLIFLFYLPAALVAQSMLPGKKPTSVPSPEAASLMKFVETPVSYFNGIPDISIPLHEIDAKGMSVPVTLRYHSNGLKVTEESSWVGLSWSLEAGGAITHVPMGRHDESRLRCPQFEFGTMLPQLSGTNYQNVGNINTDAAELYKPSGEQYTFDYLEQQDWWDMEGEIDLYMYNFNGYSGKFIKVGGSYYDLTHNKIKFVKGVETFSATTPDGVKYFFNIREVSRSMGFLDGGLPTPDGCDYDYKTTAYFLTRIESPFNATDAIDFTYKSFEELYDPLTTYFEPYDEGASVPLFPEDDFVPQMSSYSGTYEHSPDYQGERKTLHTEFIYPYYLTRIDFPTGHLEFEISPRQDLYGFKLDEIRIYRTGEEDPAKKYSFNYDYFTSAQDMGSDYFDLPGFEAGLFFDYPENYKRKRLKLLAITELSAHGSEGKKYRFEYFEGSEYPFPYKSSLSQDYWGYYNAAPNLTTLVPDFRRYMYRMEVPLTLANWRGANREPREKAMKTGMLKKIVYPTKGWTEFDYEINRYTNLTWQQGTRFEHITYTAEDVNRDPSDPWNGAYRAGMVEKEFAVTSPTSADVLVYLWCSCNNNACDCDPDGQIRHDCPDGNAPISLFAQIDKWNASSGSWQTISHWDNSKPEIRNCPNGGGGFHSFQLTMTQGRYRIKVNLPDSKGGVPMFVGSPATAKAAMSVTIGQAVEDDNPANDGGGLRVSRIANYDPDTGKTNERTFTYENGIMTRFPMFYSRSVIRKWKYNYAIPFDDIYDYLYSSPVLPYSYSANGSLVGYGKVTEHIAGNGRTVYTYKIREDKLNFVVQTDYGSPKYLPGVPSTPHPDNGMLLTTSFYKEGATEPTKRITNFYSDPLDPKIIWNFKTEVVFPEAHTAPDWCSPLICYDDIVTNTRLSFYPINIGKVVLERTEETTFTDNGSIAAVKEYKYDNLEHLQLTRQIESKSDGNKNVTRFLYPGDYTNTTGFIGEMKTANMIGLPVETVKYTTNATGGNVNITGAKLSVYKTGDRKGLLDKEWFLESVEPVPLSSFRFSNQANVNVLPENGTPTSFALSNKDSRYPAAEKLSYEFDDSGNLIQIKSAGDAYESYKWGYENTKPVCVAVNAQAKDVFYTSFEEDGVAQLYAKSGDKVRTANFTRTLTGLTNGAYILSYWKKNGEIWEPVTVPVTVTGGTYTINITAVLTSAPIDEVRFHPENAQLTTYTYHTVFGATSVTDSKGSTQHFEYDNKGRLELVRDTDRNITKRIEYQYKR